MPIARYDWRKFCFEIGTKYLQCPISQYPTLVSYWQTHNMEFENARMKNVRARYTLYEARQEGTLIAVDDGQGPSHN